MKYSEWSPRSGFGSRRGAGLFELGHGACDASRRGAASRGAFGHGIFQPRAEALALVVVPELEEALEEQLAGGRAGARASAARPA